MQARNRSKQNQLYRYIAETLLNYPPRIKTEDYTPSEKSGINNFLSNSIVKMYNYPIIDFDYMATKEQHQFQRQKVLQFEKEIINLFKYANKELINRSTPPNLLGYKSLFPNALAEIKQTFSV